jgi:N-carbamoyl-L-amino-acid hydrolase
MLKINPGRYWRTVERSAEIGVGRPGGLARVALSDADREMRDQFAAWCREEGCTVEVDGVGNMFATRPGTDPGAAAVAIGSHLDTQVNGGRYDGIVGVLAGLEVIRTLNEKKLQTVKPVVVVNWTNEEGARFSPPMIASGAFAGVYKTDWVLDRRDDEGKRFGDELARIGYAGAAPVGARRLDSYFELHIEQGPLLHAKGIDVGVVTHGYTAHGFIVEVKGETAHTGPWPMDKRKNALVGAAMLAVAAHEIGWKYHATEGKGTAARIVAWPNKPGILSDWAQFTGDLRHEDPKQAGAMLGDFLAAMPECAKRANVEMKIVDQWTWNAELFDKACIGLVRDTAATLGYRSLDLPSQAGHDAYFVARVAPTAMIFTPCTDGITHNNHEHATLERTVPGVNALLNVVLARAK